MKNLRNVVAVPLILALLAIISPPARAIPPVITNYNLPCRKNTTAYMTTFHSTDRDGTGKVDKNRRSYDIRCAGNLVFAPATARVYSIGSGMLRLDDRKNNACLVLLHITDVAVGKGMTVRKGTYLGRGSGAGGHVHVAAVAGPCRNWPSDISYANMGKKERDIKWAEVGKVLPPGIGAVRTKSYTSRNPGDIFVGGSSSLTVTKNSVKLRVCASNLRNGQSVYVSVWRPAAGSRRAWYRLATAQARNGCALFYLQDNQQTLRGVTYYTVASLARIPTRLASLRRTSCGSATGGAELCDAARR